MQGSEAVHGSFGPNSNLEITLPWVVSDTGYVTEITGQLLQLKATASLQHQSLVESETLKFTIKYHHPILWNEHQE
jgi:hypothetical protein